MRLSFTLKEHISLDSLLFKESPKDWPEFRERSVILLLNLCPNWTKAKSYKKKNCLYQQFQVNPLRITPCHVNHIMKQKKITSNIYYPLTLAKTSIPNLPCTLFLIASMETSGKIDNILLYLISLVQHTCLRKTVSIPSMRGPAIHNSTERNVVLAFGSLSQ